jgi:para-aminobenzoate synthetase component 1
LKQGRYDIIAADPMQTLVTRGDVTEICQGGTVEMSTADPFDLLRQALGPPGKSVHELPFSGGALGYFSYDLGRRIETLPQTAANTDNLPDMAVGLYDWALVVDHLKRRSFLVTHGRDSRTAQRWADLVSCFRAAGKSRRPEPFRVLQPPRSNMDFADYTAAFHRIKHYIREGDCYQVNFAQRFESAVEGSPWACYRALRRDNPAPFSAYLNTPDCQVLSSSPERFLQVREQQVKTRPIKGTRPRGSSRRTDLQLADELQQSAKDRAENVMIVDLMRNDLGRVCRAGSIRVPELFALESFTSVHHLVSTVTGSLAAGNDALHLLRACFPGGSITGAPKLRAMEIIEELEPHRRGVYCGSIGYLGFDGAMDSSIAIRTMVHSNGSLRIWAGGGIVADSDLQAEYRETYYKIAAMLDLLDQLGMNHVGSEGRRQSCHR